MANAKQVAYDEHTPLETDERLTIKRRAHQPTGWVSGSEEDARERFLACIGIDWYGAATYRT